MGGVTYQEVRLIQAAMHPREVIVGSTHLITSSSLLLDQLQVLGGPKAGVEAYLARDIDYEKQAREFFGQAEVAGRWDFFSLTKDVFVLMVFLGKSF
jgi:hypothetical protein